MMRYNTAIDVSDTLTKCFFAAAQCSAGFQIALMTVVACSCPRAKEILVIHPCNQAAIQFGTRYATETMLLCLNVKRYCNEVLQRWWKWLRRNM